MPSQSYSPFLITYPPRKELYSVNSPIEIRKVIIGVVLAIVWMCLFIFIKDSISIDWNGDASNLTSLKMVLGLIGFLVIVFYLLLVNTTAETKN